MTKILHLKVHNFKLGVQIPLDSPVRQLLLTEKCLRQTMNLWFSHGQPTVSNVIAESCCSVCMRQCLCEMCTENIAKFQPRRNIVNVAKTQIVKKLSQYLTELEINHCTVNETPTYDPFNLAEVLIVNLLESQYKDLLTFKEYLGVFSLGNEVIESVYNYVVLNEAEIMSICDSKVVQLVKETNNDSDSNESIDDEREFALSVIFIVFCINGGPIFHQ